MVADRMIAGRHRTECRAVGTGRGEHRIIAFRRVARDGSHRAHGDQRSGGWQDPPVAGLVHAVTILLVMLVASRLIGYLAMPALAGLLILTAWNMSEPHKWRGYLAERKSDIFLLALTMILTVVADLAVAIGDRGVALGLAFRLQRRNVPPSDWSDPDR